MTFRGHGNGIAIALAALAVVIAATGTAVAVTATVVHIQDPANGAVARVDSAGRLTTRDANATIDSTGLAAVTSGDNFITSPTTAVLAVSKLSFSDPTLNATASNTEIRYYFYKTGVDGNGQCSLSSAVLLGIYNIAPGDDFEETFPAPLFLRPTGSAKYCLDLYAVTLNGTYTAGYYPSYNLTAYVAGGTYAGVGANSARSTPGALTKREKAATGH